MSADRDDLDASALAVAVRSGELTAKELTEDALGRIDERNGAINAIVERRDTDALADAAAVDAATAEERTMPLAGVPFVVKDLGVTVAGMHATQGSRLFADVVADRDSVVVERFRRAGAVIVGMTNSPELGKNASTEPVLHGPTRNPHHLGRSPGGSSGGTAAAMAAGIVPTGHGNDGGGSIRIPAAACGLVGLKPSRGRVPAAPARTAIAYPMGVNLGLTRTVRDSALLMDVAAGPVPGDPYVIAPPPQPYRDEVGADPGRLRIGVSTTTPAGDPIDPECAAAVRAVASVLDDLDHDLDEAMPTYPLEALSAVSVLMAAPLTVDIDARLQELGRDLADDDLEPFTRSMYERGKSMTGSDVITAQRDLEYFGNEVGRFFVDHDLLLTATLAEQVQPLGWLDTTNIDAMFTRASRYSALTVPSNITGQPAISLPLGRDDSGLPIGIQLVAAFGREDLLLRVAAQLEAATPWNATPVWPPDPDRSPIGCQRDPSAQARPRTRVGGPPPTTRRDRTRPATGRTPRPTPSGSVQGFR